MLSTPDLAIPEVKPAIESVRGRWYQKMSPRSRHAILQTRLGTILTNWMGERGVVGTEWRSYFIPGNEKPSSLVPDVSAYFHARMAGVPGDESYECPTVSPDVAVEILSPDDRRPLLDEKIALYLRFGSGLVIVVDPELRTVTLHDAAGAAAYGNGQTARPAATCPFDDLALDLESLFAGI